MKKVGPAETQSNLEARRAMRHESRTASTYKHFLHDIAEVTALAPEQAEQAAVAVVSALESRIVDGEARNLAAQLPFKLQEQLRGAPEHGREPARKLKRREFCELVASALNQDAERAEQAIRGVFEVIASWIAPAEVVKVVHGLPEDLRELWPPDVQAEVEQKHLHEAQGASAARRRKGDSPPQPSRRDELDGYAEHILAMPTDAQLGFLHRLVPRVLASLGEEARESFLRNLLAEVGRTERGEPGYGLGGEPTNHTVQ